MTTNVYYDYKFNFQIDIVKCAPLKYSVIISLKIGKLFKIYNTEQVLLLQHIYYQDENNLTSVVTL